MNQELIEMAAKAGIEFTNDPTETPMTTFAECWIEELEAFAALVEAKARAAEREACAKLCELGADAMHPTVRDHLMKNFGGSTHLAQAIRARGETK